MRRLAAYGVPEKNLVFTGFPLPHELLGGEELPALRKNLAARLVRLDPKGVFREAYGPEVRSFTGALPDEERGRAPHLVFAVGGTGAQLGIVRQFLPSLREPIRAGRLRLTLVAGVRADTAASLRVCVQDAMLDGAVDVLHEPRLLDYFTRFNALLAGADLLWTKPSEMTFFGALGIPLLFAPPIGVHERYNQRWAIESGVGFRARDLRATAGWLEEWLNDGTLAAAAWSGAMRMPKSGLYRILAELRGPG